MISSYSFMVATGVYRGRFCHSAFQTAEPARPSACGEHLPAIGCTLVTADRALVPADRLTLLGPDLPQIHADVPYARIALIRTDDASRFLRCGRWSL